MQTKSRARALIESLLASLLCFLVILVPMAYGQQTQGSMTITVLDPTESLISGAELKLIDQSTNDVRNAITQDGNYKFVNLNFGSYQLVVSKPGFESQSTMVVVQSARNSDIKVTLKVGSASQVVEVQGGTSPVVETTSSATNMTIDTKQIENLPLSGRNIAQFSKLAAGYNGTWNGLPTMAQGSTVDGIVGNSGRWKYSQSADTSVGIAPRLETIGEMTVATDQLDLNQGWGNSNMQIAFVTRRGTNQFHGRLFEDFRNSALNATPWRGTKANLILNEFGGSLGGPIVKDKLFFFGSFSMSKQPSPVSGQNYFFNSNAQKGIFTRSDGTTVNLFNAVAAYNTANGTSLPTSVLPITASRFGEINGYVGKGYVDPTASTDPNITNVYWNQSNSLSYYYPTVRLDYTPSQKMRISFAYNQTKMTSPSANPGWFPDDGRQAGNSSNAFAGSLGWEYTISPTIINQAKFGYLYTAAWFGTGGPTDYISGSETEWNYANPANMAMSGLFYNLPNSRLQPVFSFSDNLSWVKGKHTFSFGVSWYREQDKYWDPPEGYPITTLALAQGDPALQALTNASLGLDPSSDDLGRAQQLYAVLSGRVSDVSGRHAYDPATGKYATGVAFSTLNELMHSWGLSFQDSFKVKSNLTLNYGLRWDFVSPNKDLTGKYHTANPESIFGPSGVGNVFKPGTLSGTMNPVWAAAETAYNGWNVTPQPAIGIAWSPRSNGSFLERMLGGDGTVVRAGYALRRFTEPQQFVWDVGSSYANAFYQSFSSIPSTSGAQGTFVPGSVVWGGAYPSYSYAPNAYAAIIPMSGATFSGDAVAGMNPNIRQPYTQSWNLGIQRSLGGSRALEVRYNGSHTIHQWLAQNINEVNIYENGFLNEFKAAQGNYTINHANGVESFANMGLAGQQALPIMTASGVDFTDATFINNLKLGQAGSMAGTLANTPDYYCNMAGSRFSPCGTSYGPGVSAYPINFWQTNPFAIGSWTGAAYMNDSGFANYNALQMEFRQSYWHGLAFLANYTWSHTLGVATAGDWMGGYTQVTLRDIKSNYGPASTDRQQVIHVSATYDLPFGKGKSFLNQGGILDKIVGGWTGSTIVTWQTGAPFKLAGSNQTINDQPGAYGIQLNGITAQDLQDHVGVFYNSKNQVRYLDPEWVSAMQANGSIKSFSTAGELGQQIYLHGPNQTYVDIGITKAIPITERVRFTFQSEFINAFNHPVFWSSGSGRTVSNTGFGAGALQSNTKPRNIEFRANLEF